SNFVQPSVKAVHHIGHALHPSARVLIYDLGCIISAEDISTQLIHFAPNRIDAVAQTMCNRARPIGLRRQVLDVGADLAESFLVLGGVVYLAPILLQQIGYM